MVSIFKLYKIKYSLLMNAEKNLLWLNSSSVKARLKQEN